MRWPRHDHVPNFLTQGAFYPSASWNPENIPGQHRHALPIENELCISRAVWLPRSQAREYAPFLLYWDLKMAC